MNAHADLLHDLRRVGACVRARAGAVQVRGCELTADQRAGLAAGKAELLALLALEETTGYRVGDRVVYGSAGDAAADSSGAADPHPGTCPACGRANLGRLPGDRIACECGTTYVRGPGGAPAVPRPSAVVGRVVDVTPAGIVVRWLGRGTEARYTFQEAEAWVARSGDPAAEPLDPAPRPCSTCASDGPCAGRVRQPDGGWACRDALSNGLLGIEGGRRRSGERRVPA